MKKILMIALCLGLMPMLFGAQEDALPRQADHAFKVENPTASPYTGPRSTPTLIDQIDLSPLHSVGYCWGITYDWEIDALWVSLWNSAYTWVYAIQKTSPCTKVDSFQLGGGAPSYHLGMGFAGSGILYMAGFNANIYEINMTTGAGTVFRTLPWSGAEGMGFNSIDDAAYPGDWGADQCAWAQPAQSGSWNTWSLVNVSGLSSAYSTSSPEWLFTCDEASPGQFYQHSLTAGVPNTTPDSTWTYDPGQTQTLTADCAFDGQYVYILDQSGPDMIWVYDVGFAGSGHDVGTSAILAPGASEMPNTTLDPAATYRNYGSGSETFDVYFEIDSSGVNIYNQTDNITLAPGDTTITWPSWTTCGTIGTVYDITAYTVLSGDENPANDTLSQTCTIQQAFWEILDPPVFPSPTGGHSEATAHDGYYYVFGCGGGNNEVQVYDIANNTWAAGTSNPSGAAFYGTANYAVDKYYRIGGWNGSTAIDIVDIYDPAGSTWSSGATAPALLIDHISGVYNDSLIYCLGGGNWYSSVAPNTDVYFYDVYNDAWTTATSFSGVGRGCTGGGIIDTFAIVACGYDGSAMRIDYIVGVIDPANPATIAWGSPTNIPGIDSLYRMPSGVDVFNKELWLTCGQKWTTQINRTFSYAVYTDTWTEWAFPKPQVVANVTPIAITTTTAGDLGLYVAGGAYGGNPMSDHELFHTGKTTGIEEQPGHSTGPLTFGFVPNIPNPVSGYTAIQYTTTKSGKASLKVYDGLGRLVRTLVDRSIEPAGSKTVYWNGKDDARRDVANGVYFLKLDAQGETATQKMILVK